jgi:hypothetical protein
MPARIVIVHDDADFTRRMAAVLWAGGHEVAVFEEPLLAHDAIEAAQRVEVLIVRYRRQRFFGRRRPSRPTSEYDARPRNGRHAKRDFPCCR